MQGTEGKFYTAVVELYKENEGHPQHEVWLDYTLNTNQRGEYVVDAIQAYLPFLKGKRHLDIGCGYGGTCIAFAKRGCTSIGIDYDSGLLNLAGANLADHPGLQVDFERIDCLSWEELHSLGKFDVITCNNVIEHVEVPERLIAHIRMLLKPNGIAYLTMPNAFSIGQIRKDCHYGQFGVSCLNPIDGRRFVQKTLGQASYDVSDYYPYAYYEDQFKKYDFSFHLINPVPPMAEAHFLDLFRQVASMRDEARQYLADSHLPDDILEKTEKFLEHFEKRFETDLMYMQFCRNPQKKRRLGWRLVRDYEIELWYMILRPASIRNKTIFNNFFGRARRKALRLLSSYRFFSRIGL